MPSTIIPVVLSGGSGTRLWPLSRAQRPKQLLPLVTERTLLQETLQRTRGVQGSLAEPIVVCAKSHRSLIAEQLREIDSPSADIVLEPEGRNTAPALAVAARLASRRKEGRDALLLVLPADHVILDTRAFAEAVAVAARAAEAGRLVTFGVVPTGPETGYGYLLRGADRGGWFELEKFVEKPDLATARGYVESGRYLWNSGMFVCRADAYLSELERFAPAIAAAADRAAAEASVREPFIELGDAFLASPSDSIDYAVMEKTDKAAVVPLDAGWSDVGSWAALHEVLAKDSDGNVLRGDVVAEGCRNSYVASTSRLVAVIGLEGVVVVETPDAVVVMRKDDSQRVKNIVDRLKAAKRDDLR